jgi:hypothetical protein
MMDACSGERQAHICPATIPEKQTAVRMPDGTLSVPPILPTPMRWVAFDWGEDGVCVDYWRCPLCGEITAVSNKRAAKRAQ